MERWLSVKEIADHLGVKRDTVYKWVRTTDIPFHRIGKLVKFQISEIDKWVRNGKDGS